MKVITETVSSLDEQFLFLTESQAAVIYTLSTIGFLFLGFFLGVSLSWRAGLLGALFFGIGGYHLPKKVIRAISQKRLKEIERQIPDFLKMILGALRAGLSVSEAMKKAVQEIPPPLSQELGLVLKKIKMGESFEESFKYLDRRLNLEEISLVVSAIILSNEAGGSLTSVLERLERTIEERKRLKGKIDALTAQGKMQGWVVGCLPFLLGVVLFLIDPGLMTPFWTSLSGGIGLFAILLLEMSGFFLIKRIVQGEA
ncbi:MAG: type II secretion system F family protein [Nitrospirae bacterium]|nr:type II secretion system F family protein [Nitrospirota bacterium]